MRLALAVLALHVAVAQDIRTLRCNVEPILPSPLYTRAEIAGGFRWSIPLAQYRNGRPERGWKLEARFESATGTVTDLAGHLDLAAADRDNAVATWSYWIGPGTYSVKLAITDEQGGTCRDQKTVTVAKWRGSGPTRAWAGVFVPGNIPPDFDLRTQIFLSSSKYHPGTAADTVRLPAPRDEPGTPTGQRITMLLDAPGDPRDQLAVLDAFEVLLARLHATAVRLVVFSLHEGHEVLRKDDFQAAEIGEIRAVTSSLRFRAVSVAELASHPLVSPEVLLDTLVQREVREAQRSGVVIFLGSGQGRAIGKPMRLSQELPRVLPPFSYIELVRAPEPPHRGVLTPIPGPGVPPAAGPPQGPRADGQLSGGSPDSVTFMPPGAMVMLGPPSPLTWLVKKLHGTISLVDVDKDFDRAVELVRKSLR